MCVWWELETGGLEEGRYKFKGKSVGKRLILWLGQGHHGSALSVALPIWQQS